MASDGSAISVWPRLGLAVEDSVDLARHLEREYGPALPGGRDLDAIELGLRIGRLRSRGQGRGSLSGRRYKTTSWTMRLGRPADDPIHAELAIRGVFGRSLAQSLVVEPLLAMSLSRRDVALVPAAGIVTGGGGILLAGASRSGKSTLAMRGWARGLSILGDDRVVLESDGTMSSFPRRLRLYPDLRSTAPAAYARLGRRVRSSLVRAEAIRRLTLGWVGLPVLVPAATILRPGPVQLGRIAIIERRDEEQRTRWLEGPAPAIARLEAVVRRDVAAIAAHDREWATEASQAVERILRICSEALDQTGARSGVLVVPGRWPAPTALAAVEGELGLTE